jgi:hypothetical protein
MPYMAKYACETAFICTVNIWCTHCLNRNNTVANFLKSMQIVEIKVKIERGHGRYLVENFFSDMVFYVRCQMPFCQHPMLLLLILTLNVGNSSHFCFLLLGNMYEHTVTLHIQLTSCYGVADIVKMASVSQRLGYCSEFSRLALSDIACFIWRGTCQG